MLTAALPLWFVFQYHSSLASLNGLEAHLRTVAPGAPGAPGPYVFAHFDHIQSTLTSEAPSHRTLSSRYSHPLFTFSASSLIFPLRVSTFPLE